MAKQFNSATDCPYDLHFCPQKAQRLNEWKASIANMAKNHANQTFVTQKNMFAGCAIADKYACVRYQRYLAIVEEMKEKWNRKNH